MDLEREMTYLFLQLPYCESLRILLWFDLIDDDDKDLKIYEIFHRVFKKANDRGIIDQLRAEIIRKGNE